MAERVDESAGASKPRVLVTGFGAFPGAPVNPTEALITELERRRADFAGLCDLELALFEVDYRTLPQRLDSLGCPDIALHFGLSAAAKGFRLEQLARNEIRPLAPDNAGYHPGTRTICDFDESFASSLPLDAIHDALASAGLPVDFSDDAGGYLCNFLFYHARAGLCSGYRPPMAGFTHVPLLSNEAETGRLTFDQLVAGAEIILRATVATWSAGSGA